MEADDSSLVQPCPKLWRLRKMVQLGKLKK